MLVLLLALLIVATRGRELVCDTEQVYRYKYISVAKSFGGEIQDANQLMDLSAEIELSCSAEVAAENTSSLLFIAEFKNVLLKQSVGQDWDVVRGDAPDTEEINLDKYFAQPMAINVLSSGRLQDLYAHETEEPWVRQMKKGIVDLLNSRIDIDEHASHDDQSAMGKHTSRFSTVKDEHDNKIVRREWDHNDFKTEEMDTREVLISGEHQVVVSPSGAIIKAEAVHSVKIGANDEKEHEIFQTLKEEIGYADNAHADVKEAAGSSGLFTNSEAVSTLQLIEVVPRKEKHLDLYLQNFLVQGSNRFVKLSDSFVPKRHMIKHGLMFDKEAIEQANRRAAKLLLRDVDLEKTLNDFELSSDAKTHAKISEFIAYHPKESLRVLTLLFDRALLEDKSHEYLSALQSFMISAQTDEGQLAAILTATTPKLVKSYILSSYAIESPSKATVEHMRALSLDKSFHETLSEIPHMAYFALADMAHKCLGKDYCKRIVPTIMSNIKSERHQRHLVGHVQALYNTRHATPLSTWIDVLSRPLVTSEIHTIAAHALKHRLSDEDSQVNELVHNIITTDHLHSSVKAAAIRSQTHRHHNSRKASSVDFLAQNYHELADDGKKAVHEYLYSVGSKHAGNTLKSLLDGEVIPKDIDAPGLEPYIPEEGDDEEDDEGPDQGNAVSDYFKKLGEMFRKIPTLVGNKTCIIISKDNNQVCTINSLLATQIQNLGDISSAKHAMSIDYEKLIGSENAHIYVGTVNFLAYDTDKNDSCTGKYRKLEALGYARGVVQAKILTARFPVLDLRGEIGGMGSVQSADVSTVTVHDKVVWTQNFVGTLQWDYDKNFQNLIKKKINVMVGPFPLAFGIAVSIKLGIHGEASIEPSKMELALKAAPYVDVGVVGSAALSIELAEGGVKLGVQMRYTVFPAVKYEKCQVCIYLGHEIGSCTISVSGFANAMSWEREKEIYSWSSQPIHDELYKHCLK